MKLHKGFANGIPSRIEALTIIAAEIEQAADHYGEFSSPVEAAGVMKEELDEVWADVHGNNHFAARREALQLAAVCIRFATTETTREKKGQL